MNKYNPNLLIIEKPIISIQVFKKKYKSYLQKIYKKFSSVIVVYPMVFLARSILEAVFLIFSGIVSSDN